MGGHLVISWSNSDGVIKSFGVDERERGSLTTIELGYTKVELICE